MNNYKFSFTGRQAGAIGIFYKITDTYKAKDIHHALSLLYEDYEHISGLTIYESNRGNRTGFDSNDDENYKFEIDGEEEPEEDNEDNDDWGF